jgi:glycolate dehydrogenase FAD-binding subunit
MGDPFEAIVGAAHVLRPEADELCGARVLAVVRPGDAAQVAACLRAASESRLPLIAVGGGSKLGFGNDLDARGCIRLELGRLASMLALDPDEGVAELDAGVPLESLARAAASVGKATSLESQRAGATVGGAIAAEPVGIDFSPDARLRDDLLGLEVALANGELTRAGGRVVKNVTGFDLVRLYCGSYGTLGVVTRAIVRLRAAPETSGVTRARFPSFEAAFAALAASPPPGRTLLRARDGGVELWCRFSGAAADVVADRARAPGDSLPEAEWRALGAEHERPPAPGAARVRLAARPSDVTVLCRSLGSVAELVLPRAGVLFATVPLPEVATLATLAERTGAVFALERARGAATPACDAFGAAPPSLSLMRAVKTRFDPARVLSPGRFVAGL